MLLSSQILREMLPEIYTTEKRDFLKPTIHSELALLFYSLENQRFLKTGV